MHVKAVGAGFVRNPLVAVEAGVEMDVPLDETWDQKRAGKDDGLGGGRARAGLVDCRDAAVRDEDVVERAIGQLGVREQCFGHRGLP
jgi:hypothetical protein